MYQPKLLPRQVRALYFIKEHDGRPMTFHARRAVDEYLRQYPQLREIVAQASPSSDESQSES